jgi:hypothetical protein
MFGSSLNRKQIYLLVLIVIFATALVGGIRSIGTVPDCFNIYTWGDFVAEIGFLAVIGYLSYGIGKETARCRHLNPRK